LEESLEDARNAKLEDAKRFHREFYGAHAAEIAIVGDFDDARAADLVKSLLADWKGERAWAHVPTAHRQAPAANLTIETPDKENAILLARQALDLRDDDPDYPALFAANYILGGDAGLDSRLGKRLRQEDGLSYSQGSGLSAPSVDRTGEWTFYAIVAPQNMAKLEAAFREELARVLKDGFTEAELASAKSGALQQRLQTRAQDGALAGGWVYNLHLGRTFAFSKAFEERLAALTVADVNAALRMHLDPAKVTVVKAGDFGKARP
jgi:zinc protease